MADDTKLFQSDSLRGVLERELTEFLTLNDLQLDGEVSAHGGFGEVFRVKKKSTMEKVKGSERRAVKIVKRSRPTFEWIILKKLSHTNIVKFYDSVSLPPSSEFFCFQMEWAGEYSLLEWVQKNERLSENASRVIATQMLNGLGFLHERFIVHLDIKLENVMVKLDRAGIPLVKLIDFGFACAYTPGRLMELYVGSLHYVSPEIASRQRYNGPKADVWAFAVCLFSMVAGYMPFGGDTSEQVILDILTNRSICLTGMTPPLEQLFRVGVFVAEQKRLGVFQLQQHPWFRGEVVTSRLISSSSWQRCLTEDNITLTPRSVPNELQTASRPDFVKPPNNEKIPTVVITQADDSTTFGTMSKAMETNNKRPKIAHNFWTKLTNKFTHKKSSIGGSFQH
jgi:serine/threonine protein kinase